MHKPTVTGVAQEVIASYLAEQLAVSRYRDYCPNGLQVAGVRPIRRLAVAVTATRAVIEAAAAHGADALLVHHGFFWKGEDPCLVGVRRERIAALLRDGMALFAYHLPLDTHPEWGNNAQLGRRLGWRVTGAFAGDPPIALEGELDTPLTASEFGASLAHALGREPMWIPGGGHSVGRIGWCTGAAQDLIEAAAARGLDTFVSGEISERTVHIAREAGIHYFAAGHHATETLGVRALAAHLAERFGLTWQYEEIDNPV
jgi:dinuclear metal center YbgI/SA1388 family protein